ncbi:MFS transporter [Sulfolobales archaeon HS-7]|nr:MFS transporter [Sulfolobales archaeon HS-7]
MKGFEDLDKSKLSFNHIKVWYTSGMGFFTDAYDLLIISAILDIFTAYNLKGFTLNAVTEGLLTSSALISAVIGQLFFGFLGDRIGRKKVYGSEAAILTAGALLSAFSPNIWWLIGFRTLLGFGIGGDYPISATIMSEYANVKDRGKLIALVFANQGFGSLVAVAVGALSAFSLPPDIAWRVMALIGAIPAASVIYLRRKVPETPRYAALEGNKIEVEKARKFIATNGNKNETDVKLGKVGLRDFLSKYGLLLLGTAGTWFILDIAFYGTGIYQGVIISSILGKPTAVGNLILDSGIPYAVGFIGYFTAVALMDSLGRRLIQIQGFIGMGVLYFLIALVMVTSGTNITGFLIPAYGAFGLFALSYLFIDFGPNTTTFIIPAEVYPTSKRTTGHGISAAAGKTGAAITTYLFPLLKSDIGIKGIMEMLAAVSVIGAILTIFTIKEPKLKSLEDVSEDKIYMEETQ